MKIEKGRTFIEQSRNHILSRLSPQEREMLAPYASLVSLRSGDILLEPEAAVERVYFPNTAVLSVVTIMEDGRAGDLGEGAADRPRAGQGFQQAYGALMADRVAFHRTAVFHDGHH